MAQRQTVQKCAYSRYSTENVHVYAFEAVTFKIKEIRPRSADKVQIQNSFEMGSDQLRVERDDKYHCIKTNGAYQEAMQYQCFGTAYYVAQF